MFKRGYIFAGLSVAGLLIACGGSDSSGGSGSAPDFNTLKTELTVPTGTMAAGDEATVQDGLGKSMEQQEGGGGFSPLSAGGSVKPQAACSEGAVQAGKSGTCDCGGGGSVSFDLSGVSQQQQQGGDVNYTVSITANSCVDDGNTINGSIYMHYEMTQAAPQDAFLIYAIHLSLTGTRTANYDIDYMLKNGKAVFKVDVKDGSVLVSAEGSWDRNSKSGSFTVKDKNETWTCNAENGKGSCTSDKGGSRTFG